MQLTKSTVSGISGPSSCPQATASTPHNLAASLASPARMLPCSNPLPSLAGSSATLPLQSVPSPARMAPTPTPVSPLISSSAHTRPSPSPSPAWLPLLPITGPRAAPVSPLANTRYSLASILGPETVRLTTGTTLRMHKRMLIFGRGAYLSQCMCLGHVSQAFPSEKEFIDGLVSSAGGSDNDMLEGIFGKDVDWPLVSASLREDIDLTMVSVRVCNILAAFGLIRGSLLSILTPVFPHCSNLQDDIVLLPSDSASNPSSATGSHCCDIAQLTVPPLLAPLGTPTFWTPTAAPPPTAPTAAFPSADHNYSSSPSGSNLVTRPARCTDAAACHNCTVLPSGPPPLPPLFASTGATMPLDSSEVIDVSWVSVGGSDDNVYYFPSYLVMAG